jgi:serine/threonine protein kinase
LIATHDPPTLKEPEKWSSIFKDFLGRCLQLDPAERASAKELLNVSALFDSQQSLCVEFVINLSFILS